MDPKEKKKSAQKNNQSASHKLLESLVYKAIQVGASDLHVKSDRSPAIRKDRKLVLLPELNKGFGDRVLTAFIRDLLSKEEWKKFELGEDLDVAYTLRDKYRFRLNIYRDRGKLSLAFRRIPREIPLFRDLHLPDILSQLAMEKKGLVLVTGAAGNGKSTTLASMLNYRNANTEGHILTLEDPIEFLLEENKSLITQRQVGQDVPDFLSGLKSSLRQDPDVIMLGEMRDADTFLTAMSAAETGQLVFSTLHTRDSMESLSRVLSFFNPDQRAGIKRQFAGCLKAVVSLRLIPAVAHSDLKTGMVPGCEILVNTPHIKELLLQDTDKWSELRNALETGKIYGMQSLDQSIMELFEKNWISRERAVEYASSKDNMELRLRGIHNNFDDAA